MVPMGEQVARSIRVSHGKDPSSIPGYRAWIVPLHDRLTSFIVTSPDKSL